MLIYVLASQVALVVMNWPGNAGDIRDQGSILGSGRSPGGGHGNPLKYSCLENPMGLQRVGHDCSNLAHTCIDVYVILHG